MSCKGRFRCHRGYDVKQPLLLSDYEGALKSGLHALLLRRLGKDDEGEGKEQGENLDGVTTVHSLDQVVEWVIRQNDA